MLGDTVIIVAGETVCKGISYFGVIIVDLPLVEMRVDYCRR